MLCAKKHSEESKFRHTPEKSYPMPRQGAHSGASHHDIAKTCQTVCRLHELIREQVWKIRRLSILAFNSEVGISRFVDSLTWRKGLCAQLARA